MLVVGGEDLVNKEAADLEEEVLMSGRSGLSGSYAQLS